MVLPSLLLSFFALLLSACDSDATNIVEQNPGDVLTVASVTAAPDTLRTGDRLVLAIDVIAQNAVQTAEADLSAIGGGDTLALLDDGQGDDQNADDRVYTLGFDLPGGISDGRKDLSFRFVDTRGFSYNGFVSVVVDNASPQVSNFTVSSTNAMRGDNVTFSVDVQTTTTISSVVADLTPFGASASVALNDGGTGGDVTAGDGTWSLEYTIPSNSSLGTKDIVVTAEGGNGRTGSVMGEITIDNEQPQVDVGNSSVGAQGSGDSMIESGQTIALAIDASDADGAQPTVTADVSAIGGPSDLNLVFNATSGLFEADYVVPTNAPIGASVINVVVRDSDGVSVSQQFNVTIRGWAGVAGSATGDGLASSIGWTFGSACVTDAAGNIYVAYSQRVNVPASIKTSGWMYAVYVQKYDVTSGLWVGLDGSDSGYGLNLTTEGRVISAGYMGDIRYYADTHQGVDNREAIYIVFHGDPDLDSGDNEWDSFLYRWNITDEEWESLGSGVEASDYINDAPTDGVQDAGGFTFSGERAQEPRLAFDSATDDVYVTYHAQDTATGDYGVYVKYFDRSTSSWMEMNGGTPVDGISDDDQDNYKYPQIVIDGGFAYVAYLRGNSSGDIFLKRGDLATGQWTGPVLIHDTGTGEPGGGFPAIAVDSQSNIWVSYKVTYSGPTDQQIHVVTAPSTNWSSAGAWTGAGGGARNVAISPSTSSSSIRTRLAIDSQDRVLTVFNQEHNGQSGADRNVFVARWDGTAWGGIAGSMRGDGISDYPDEIDWLPWICVAPDDTPIVSWDTYSGIGSGNDRRKIYVKTLQ